MKALIISADHFEDSGLLFHFYRFFRLKEEGFEVDIAPISNNGVKA